MTNDDRELGEWQEAWRTVAAADGLAPELAARAERDRRRVLWKAAREVGAAVAGSAVCVALVVRSGGALVVTAICAAILVFNGIWVAWFVAAHRDLTGRAGADAGLDDHVRITRRRLEADRAWARFGVRALAVLVPIVIAWSAWAFVTHRAAYAAEPWRALVGFGGAAAIVVGAWAWARVKAAKIREETRRFEAMLTDAPAPARGARPDAPQA